MLKRQSSSDGSNFEYTCLAQVQKLSLYLMQCCWLVHTKQRIFPFVFSVFSAQDVCRQLVLLKNHICASHGVFKKYPRSNLV